MVSLFSRHATEQSKMNLGCGENKKPGYVNLDWQPAVRPDVVHD